MLARGPRRTKRASMPRIIDFHAHFLPQGAIDAADTGIPWHGTVLSRDSDGRPLLATGNYRTGLGAVEYWEGPDQRINAMRARGVDTTILSLAPPMFRYYIDATTALAAARETNDTIRDWTVEHPDRFLGFATLPMQDVGAAIAELDRAVNDLGLVGAALGTHVEGRNFDLPEFQPFFHAAEELRALLFVHPAASRVGDALPRYHMRNFIGNPFETTVAIGSLIFGGVLERFPDLKMVFAHGGGFACADIGRFDHGHLVRDEAREHARLLPSEYLRRLYVDCLTHGERELRLVLDTVGTDRVVLGTDYPADMGLTDPRNWIARNSSLADDERERILSGNGMRLLDELRR
jgi:aminocarboxymuconate-semialdehyde decarboxylase